MFFSLFTNAYAEGVKAPCLLCCKPLLCSLSSIYDNFKEGEKEEYGKREGGASSASISIPSHPSLVSLLDLLVEAAALKMEV